MTARTCTGQSAGRSSPPGAGEAGRNRRARARADHAARRLVARPGGPGDRLHDLRHVPVRQRHPLTPLFGTPYEVDGYLSPLFSPLIAPDWLPSWISPGLLILWIPLGFRATCYYYRKAYYRFYFADPPGCAVGEPTVHRRYQLEAAFPFILQNLHRYFLYLAFIPLFFLWVDAVAVARSTTAGSGSASAARSSSSTSSC